MSDVSDLSYRSALALVNLLHFMTLYYTLFRLKLKMANKNLSQIFLKINSMRHKGKLHRETDCSLSPEKHRRIAQNCPTLSRDRKLLHLPEIPLNEKEVQVGMKLSPEKQQKMISAHLSPLTKGSV